jgi:hypothetical protein
MRAFPKWMDEVKLRDERWDEELRRLYNREQTEDPGVKPGGIRERALQSVLQRVAQAAE